MELIIIQKTKMLIVVFSLNNKTMIEPLSELYILHGIRKINCNNNYV